MASRPIPSASQPDSNFRLDTQPSKGGSGNKSARTPTDTSRHVFILIRGEKRKGVETLPNDIIGVFNSRGSAGTCAQDIVAFYNELVICEFDGILIMVECRGRQEVQIDEWRYARFLSEPGYELIFWIFWRPVQE